VGIAQFARDRLGPALLDKQVWYVSHLLFALPVVLGEPLQFIAPS